MKIKPLMKISGYFVIGFMGIMVFVVGANVISRYFLGINLNWVDEVSRFSFVWLSFIGIVVALYERQHVRVEYFRNLFNPRIRYLLTVIGEIVAIVFIVFLIYGGIRTAMVGYAVKTPYLGISYVWLYLAVCVSAPLLLAVFLWQLKKSNSKEEKR